MIFVHAVALCSQLQSFTIFFTFLHFSQELLVWSWSIFDFCSCCGTLQPIVKFQNFLHFFAFFWRTTGLHQTLIFVHAVAFCSHLQCFQIFLHFFAFFSGTTGLILINLWFLFMLCHSAANCKVSKFSSLFCIFLKNYWSSSNIWFLFMLWHSAATCKVSQFSQFLHFSRNYWFDLDQIFDFCLCCGTLQPIVKFQNFLHFFAFFSGTTGLILIKLLFLFMLCHSAANCKVSKFFHFFAFF